MMIWQNLLCQQTPTLLSASLIALVPATVSPCPQAVAADLADKAIAICGGPDESISGKVKAELEGSAQTLYRIAAAELKGAVEGERERILVGKDRSDAERELHFLNSVSCVLIVADKTMSTAEKLDRLRQLREGLQLPTPAGALPSSSTPSASDYGRTIWEAENRCDGIARIVGELRHGFSNIRRKAVVPGQETSEATYNLIKGGHCTVASVYEDDRYECSLPLGQDFARGMDDFDRIGRDLESCLGTEWSKKTEENHVDCSKDAVLSGKVCSVRFKLTQGQPELTSELKLIEGGGFVVTVTAETRPQN
jgi:hypothetical protein